MNLQALESAICGNMTSELQGPARQMFMHYIAGELTLAYTMASDLYLYEKDQQVKSFWLHLLCVISEMKYDLALRRSWMNKWHQQLTQDKSDFARAAARYHQAHTCYFESHLVEALNRYKELADNMATPSRFKALAHFHLGLIYQQRQLLRAARNEMKAALQITQELGHLRLLSRIREQISEIDNGIQFSFLDQEVCSLIRERSFVQARKLYIQKRESERARGIQRGQSSLHALVPGLIAISSGHIGRIMLALEFVNDPAVKVQSIGFLLSLGVESPELKSLHDLLSIDLGIVPEELKEMGAQFLGMSLKEIPQEDLQKFASYLLSENTVDKAGICQKVWGLDYDPVVHDGKVYKLIHRFRDYFGKKDLIVNRYGKYEVNQKYRA